MKEDLETKRLDGLRTAKIDTRHSHRLVLELAWVRKPSLYGFSGRTETSLNLQRRGKVLVEGGGRGRDGELQNFGAFELLRGVFKKK
jgi:hypothetical protein